MIGLLSGKYNMIYIIMESLSADSLPKNIFLLWMQGWDNASWLHKKVAESWVFNNPEWKIHYIDLENLKDYISDIDYIYDKNKNISMQAKSDIIRISLLKNHGGIWADATMLCMQSLDHWVFDAVEPAGIWMYHGGGGGMSTEVGPASWFIVAKKDNIIMTKWKIECDRYWNNNNFTNNYFWMDGLFKNLFETDVLFKHTWLQVPYLCCENDGQAHSIANYGIENDTPHIKKLFLEKPPYALKLANKWNNIFHDINTEKCKKSNGYFAIKLSQRKYEYKHEMANFVTYGVYKYIETGINLERNHLIRFKTSNDAHIGLFDKDVLVAEIVIGGWDNTSSVIRYKAGGDKIDTINYGYCNQNEYKSIIVDVNDNMLTVSAYNFTLLKAPFDNKNLLNIRLSSFNRFIEWII